MGRSTNSFLSPLVKTGEASSTPVLTIPRPPPALALHHSTGPPSSALLALDRSTVYAYMLSLSLLCKDLWKTEVNAAVSSPSSFYIYSLFSEIRSLFETGALWFA